MPIPTRDRFTGCIVGQCIGDALGFPVEGFPPHACEQYLEEFLSGSGTMPVGRDGYRFGQYTDDSQLARELIQSYVECGRFDPDNYADRIAAIFQEDRVVGRGIATDQAARRLAAGVPWQKAGTPAPSAGNGTAMRAAPVGLIFADNPNDLIRVADGQGRITHTDGRCSAGSVAIAGCVALALRRPFDSEKWLLQLSVWVAKMDEAFGQYILELREWLKLSPEDAVAPISSCGIAPGYQDGWKNISPFVVSSVLWSLYSFFRSPDDYMEIVRTAIAVGGDVDSTGAMAGAIAGTYLGVDSLPADLSRIITDQGTWEYNELINLAHRCYDLKYGEVS